MKLYLTPDLQAHRRGRFLASLLAIKPSSEPMLPSSGLVLMTGEHLQASPELQAECVAWARQPGCTLLLLPSYKEGAILPPLDWVIEFSSAPLAAAQPESVDSILAGELSYQLHGMDGSSATATQSGDLAGVPSCHTRYWKAHSNSGLIAATTLPLWSISLLDHADKVMAFLAEIDKHTGKASPHITQEEPQVDAVQAQDVTVLVCCYGFDVTTATGLSDRLNGYAMPLLKLDSFDLPKSINRLRCVGFLDDKGLTEAGLAFLQDSKYWSFAENLKERPSQ